MTDEIHTHADFVRQIMGLPPREGGYPYGEADKILKYLEGAKTEDDGLEWDWFLENGVLNSCMEDQTPITENKPVIWHSTLGDLMCTHSGFNDEPIRLVEMYQAVRQSRETVIALLDYWSTMPPLNTDPQFDGRYYWDTRPGAHLYYAFVALNVGRPPAGWAHDEDGMKALAEEHGDDPWAPIDPSTVWGCGT
jgi:hypothetical protein